jgi:hypothetical protein
MSLNKVLERERPLLFWPWPRSLEHNPYSLFLSFQPSRMLSNRCCWNHSYFNICCWSNRWLLTEASLISGFSTPPQWDFCCNSRPHTHSAPIAAADYVWKVLLALLHHGLKLQPLKDQGSFQSQLILRRLCFSFSSIIFCRDCLVSVGTGMHPLSGSFPAARIAASSARLRSWFLFRIRIDQSLRSSRKMSLIIRL